jgi:hypothetical protein
VPRPARSAPQACVATIHVPTLLRAEPRRAGYDARPEVAAPPVIPFLLALGCAAPAPGAAFAQSFAAADFLAAWDACAGIPRALDRGDCQQAAIARFDQWDDCGRVEAGVWRDECAFAAAEHLARGGDRTGGLRACRATAFADNCDDHLLDSLAMDVRDGSVGAAAAAWTSIAPEVVAANGEFDFWRSYFRVRIAAQLPVDTEECPDKECRGAARREVELAFERMPKTECTSIESLPTWAAASMTQQWASRALGKRCGAAAALEPTGKME